MTKKIKSNNIHSACTRDKQESPDAYGGVYLHVANCCGHLHG